MGHTEKNPCLLAGLGRATIDITLWISNTFLINATGTTKKQIVDSFGGHPVNSLEKLQYLFDVNL